MVRGAAEEVNILLCQPYGLGNAICTTPLIQAVAKLKDRGDTAHKVSVAGDTHRAAACTILRECPGVKQFFSTNDLQAIRNQRFDLLIMCGAEPKLARSYSIPRVITPFLAREKNELHQDWYKRWTRPEYDVLFDAARSLGWKTELPAPKVPVPETPIKLEMQRPILALGVGYYKGDARSRKKHIGDHNFARIGWQFQKDYKGTVLVVGDKQDHETTGKRLAAGTPGFVSLCGKLGFKAMLSALSQVGAYVGNGTGLSHAAAALNVPTCIVLRDADALVKSKPCGQKVTMLVGAGAIAPIGWLHGVLRAVVSA